MEMGMMFLDCPAYMDKHGAIRCGLPAEVQRRYTVRSTDGPLESAKIRCPRGHWFNGAVEHLIWDKHLDAAIAGAVGATGPAGGFAASKNPDYQ